MKTRAMLLTLALPAVAMAQEHTIQIQAQKGQSLRTKLETASESTTSMTVLINGEESGRGGGGERTTTSKQTVEFDETVLATNDKGQATKVQRTYTKLSGTMTMPGRDGEETETEIEGALEGKQIHLSQDGEKVVAHEKDEDGTALDERLARGLRVRTDLIGFAPGKALAVGSEFDLSKSMRDAIANLQHPMARAVQAEEGGGNEGGGRGGGRGNRGGFGGGGRGGTMGNEGFGYLMNEKLELEATGKLESVEDGKATISFKAKSKGDGNPTELGVGMGGMGGRGGRGGRGGEQGAETPPIEGKASIECTAEGKLVVDVATKRVVSIELEGEFEMKAETSMSREGRDGQAMEIETTMDRSGTFTVKGAVSEAKGD